MMSKDNRDLSVTITSFFMKCVGFWLAVDEKEQMRRNIALYYTVGAISFAVWVETLDFYYTWGNFSDTAYIACNIMALVIVQYKILILSIHRTDFLNLIRYTQTNFWHTNYDERCSEIMATCKRRCTLFVSSFTFFAQATICCYTITPIFQNIGRNDSDRVLPFTMWINFPFSLSPYYEITYVTQILSLYHCGICYFCFDNFLCILNEHTAGQFRMLQYKLSLVCGIDDNSKSHYDSMVQILKDPPKSYTDLKDCIRQHQALISYSRKLEDIFTLTVLGQVILFSLLICLVGYQVLLADGPPARRAIFIVHISGTFCQLLMFTTSCHDLIEQSLNVADAAYAAQWHSLPHDVIGNNYRKDLLLIIARARRPCCLTAGGFFPVSLETFTAVLSTAMSYFTLMRQRSMEASSD